jgi:fumarate reductase subunit D
MKKIGAGFLTVTICLAFIYGIGFLVDDYVDAPLKHSQVHYFISGFVGCAVLFVIVVLLYWIGEHVLKLLKKH